jgi:hypothetical protein
VGWSNPHGFTLLETTIVVVLGCLLLVGFLAFLDSSSRLNKEAIGVADAQGSVRYGLNQMVRVIRMAGAGGLFVTQAVITRPDPDLGGVIAPPDDDYDNVVGGAVVDLSGTSIPVRPGTDILEVRGVIFSPLLGFDDQSGCGSCTDLAELTARSVTSTGHVNNDPRNRPQFSEIDSYTQGASDAHPMFVLVAGGDDLHAGCSEPAPGRGVPPQPTYTVARLTAPTSLSATGSFGRLDFANPLARAFTTENPRDPAPLGGSPLLPAVRRAGILDDVLYFIDDSEPAHPALARGLRRGDRFDVVALADDVEDLQVAYGVDGLYGLDAVALDGGLGRLIPSGPRDPDPDVSTIRDGDEWAPNAEGERTFEPAEFQSVQPPPPGFPHEGTSSDAHCPTLRAIMISIVAKSPDPDPGYRGADSSGIRTMNSPSATRLYPSPGLRFRRRTHTARVALRNWSAGT